MLNFYYQMQSAGKMWTSVDWAVCIQRRRNDNYGEDQVAIFSLADFDAAFLLARRSHSYVADAAWHMSCLDDSGCPNPAPAVPT